MEDYMSFLVFGICVLLSVTDIKIVQLQTVPDPCPDYTIDDTIADMCTSDFAREDDNDGGTSVDGVVLRVTKQQDGCTCDVEILNQNMTSTLNMRKYDSLKTAAPEHEACGLAVDINYDIPNNLPETKHPVKCTTGTDRTFSLSRNGILNLRSRIIDGNFSRGYCLQIYRKHIPGDILMVKINCRPQSTTVSESTLYIAIGLGSAVMVIVLFVAVVVIILRRKYDGKKHAKEVQSNAECTDYDSDELKYNTLYNSSTQNIIEGDYHTVDVDGREHGIEIKNVDGDYSAVGENCNTIDKGSISHSNGFKSNNKSEQISAIKPESEKMKTLKETRNDVEHITPVSARNDENAVVDKNKKTSQYVKHVAAPNNTNVEYAVIDKTQ